MTRCIRCHRPLKAPTETGMGRVCASRAKAVPPHERDLFGYDLDIAELAARYQVFVLIEQMAWEASEAVRKDFTEARRRLEVTT